MFQLYCDMCGNNVEYKDSHYLQFDSNEDIVYHFCPSCFKNETIRYSNYRLVASNTLKNKLNNETKNEEEE